MASLDELALTGNYNRTELGPVELLPEPAPREMFVPLISVDDHVLEPASLFDELPSRYRDAAPHFVGAEDGGPHWIVDGKRVPMGSVNGSAGMAVRDWRRQAVDYSDMRPGVWDAKARLHDMDVNGVWASLNFPSTIWGFAGKRLSMMSDPDLGLACLKTYNDWMIEQWCATSPERYVPCQLPWLADPIVAAEQIRHNAERGFRSVSFSENPIGLGFPTIYSDHWDPFLEACQETGTVINLHVGSSGNIIVPSPETPGDGLICLFPLNGIQALIDWIFSKIPLRYPDIKIVISEGGASWVPMAIERLRRSYRQVESSLRWTTEDGDPVDLLHRNFWFSSIEDPSAFHQLDIIGEDHVMLETDYPHNDGSWPDSQELIKGELRHLPPETIAKLGYENASQLYRHPLPPAEWLARSTFTHDTTLEVPR